MYELGYVRVDVNTHWQITDLKALYYKGFRTFLFYSLCFATLLQNVLSEIGFATVEIVPLGFVCTANLYRQRGNSII